jgi:hypothetical protein
MDRLAATSARLPPFHAATLAAYRFVKSTLGIEPLFARRKRELTAAITADKKSILFEHAIATPR